MSNGKHILPRNVGEILKHRQPIYGFAALWIALFHMYPYIPMRGIAILPSMFQQCGAMGVDLFLLLMPLGLKHSLDRDPNVLRFWYRRLKRVYPVAFLVMIVFGLIQHYTPVKLIRDVTFISHPLGVGSSAWYIALIMQVYLVYPLIYRIQKKMPSMLYVFLLIALAVTLLASVRQVHNDLQRSVSRLPVIVIGCILSRYDAKKLRTSKLLYFGSLIFGVGLLWLFARVEALYLFVYPIRTTIGLAAAVFFSMTVAAIAETARTRGVRALLTRCLTFCGAISMEMYLLFGKIRGKLDTWVPVGIPDAFLWGTVLNIAALILAIVVGNILRKLSTRLTSKLDPIVDKILK